MLNFMFNIVSVFLLGVVVNGLVVIYAIRAGWMKLHPSVKLSGFMETLLCQNAKTKTLGKFIYCQDVVLEVKEKETIYHFGAQIHVKGIPTTKTTLANFSFPEANKPLGTVTEWILDQHEYISGRTFKDDKRVPVLVARASERLSFRETIFDLDKVAA